MSSMKEDNKYGMWTFSGDDPLVSKVFEIAEFFAYERDATELNAAIEDIKTAHPNGVNLIAFLEDRLEEKLNEEDEEDEEDE